MSRSQSRLIDFEVLKTRGASVATVMRLMMACNDLSISNLSLGDWKVEQRQGRRSREQGARLYFLRLQIAHLFEGLKVIEALRADPSLLGLVSRCGTGTQQAFQFLQDYLPGGPRRPDFERLIGRMRHNLTFHYDESGRVIEKAISSLADSDDHFGSISRGNDIALWYFQAADRVINNAVCFQFWGIPKHANLSVEADKNAMESHAIFLHFVDFSGEFIWRYSRGE